MAPGGRSAGASPTKRSGAGTALPPSSSRARKSRISAEDFAVALLHEVERPRHLRERITLADA
jgi:putative NADH-flavin reductase